MSCLVCGSEILNRDHAQICDSCLERLVSLGCYAEGKFNQECYWREIPGEWEFTTSLVEMVMQLEERFDINIYGDPNGDWWLGPPNPEKRSSVTMSYGCGEPEGHIRPMLDAMYQEILRQAA